MGGRRRAADEVIGPYAHVFAGIEVDHLDAGSRGVTEADGLSGGAGGGFEPEKDHNVVAVFDDRRSPTYATRWGTARSR